MSQPDKEPTKVIEPLPVAIIIPARYDSKRFPGKPIHAVINGKSLIERVWGLAQKAGNAASVHVATDHDAVARHVESFGGAVLMTDPSLPSGTDRAWAALQQLPPTIGAIVNLQGDAPLTPPWVIQALVDTIADRDSPPIATPAVALTDEQLAHLQQSKMKSPSSGTTVVVSRSGKALYFSKYVLPFRRDALVQPVLRHVGLYAYKRDRLGRAGRAAALTA